MAGEGGGVRSPFGRASRLALFYVPVLIAGALWIAWREGLDGLIGAALGPGATRSASLGLALGAAITLALHVSPLRRTRPLRRMHRFFARILPTLRPGDAVLLALASGVAEEVLFRGAIQPHLGLLATSALFGALHSPPDRRLLAWPIFATVFGLLVGVLQETTGSLLGPIVAHVLVNLIGLARLAHRPSHPERHIAPDNPTISS
jgi:membrane protease YdiL (CAAX protease family)